MQNIIRIIKETLDINWIYQEFRFGISREKKIIGIAISLLAGFLLYQSMLANQFSKLESKSFQLKSKSSLLNFYEKIETDVDSLIKKANAKAIDLAETKKDFVSEDGLPIYFDNFRSRVKSLGLELLSLDIEPKEEILGRDRKPLEFFQKQPLNISVKGDYSNVMLLLYQLERDNPLFYIYFLSVTQSDTSSFDVIMALKEDIYILEKSEIK